MTDYSDKPWGWVVPLLYAAQQTMEEYGTIPTTAFFYFAPGTDPLGNTREEPELTQYDGVNLTTDEYTAQTIELLKQAAFESGPDAVMMIGEGWDFSNDKEAMERAQKGEDVQPEIVTPCIFCSVETPKTYHLSKAEILKDNQENQTFIPKSLANFEEVPNEQLAGRFARILPANKVSP